MQADAVGEVPGLGRLPSQARNRRQRRFELSPRDRHWSAPQTTFRSTTIVSLAEGGEAISLEETSNSRVWGNRASGWDIACRLYAHRDSALLANGQHAGTSFNRIGVDPQGKNRGNDFRGNSRCIVLQHVTQAHLRRNIFCANDCRDSSVPATFTGGDEAEDRQFASLNQPDDINFPHHDDRVQGR